MQATILVRLCEQPGCVHEILAYKCIELERYDSRKPVSYLGNT